MTLPGRIDHGTLAGPANGVGLTALQLAYVSVLPTGAGLTADDRAVLTRWRAQVVTASDPHVAAKIDALLAS